MSDDSKSKRTKFQGFDVVEMHRSEIKNAAYNPRQIKQTNRSRLKKGLQKHKLVEPLVFNRQTGNLVSGHQRLSILDDLEGSEDYTMQVSVIDVPPEREMALNLLLNNRAAQGEDNLLMLQGVFEELMSSEINLEDAGYTTTDAQQLFPDMFLTGEMADQFDAEAEIVAELEQMKSDGKEFEAEFRDAAGLPPTKAMQEKAEREAANAAAQAEHSGEAEPEWEDADDAPSSEPSTPPASDKTADWKHDKDYFKGERQRTVDNNADVMNETDVLLTLSFQTKQQLLDFIHAFGIDPDKRYLNIHDINAAFGTEL